MYHTFGVSSYIILVKPMAFLLLKGPIGHRV